MRNDKSVIKDSSIQIAITSEDKESLKAMAKAKGLTVADYLHEQIELNKAEISCLSAYRYDQIYLILKNSGQRIGESAVVTVKDLKIGFNAYDRLEGDVRLHRGELYAYFFDIMRSKRYWSEIEGYAKMVGTIYILPDDIVGTADEDFLLRYEIVERLAFMEKSILEEAKTNAGLKKYPVYDLAKKKVWTNIEFFFTNCSLMSKRLEEFRHSDLKPIISKKLYKKITGLYITEGA